MGRMLIEAIQHADDAVLAGALDLPGTPGIGTDAAAFLGSPAGVAIEAELERGLADADYLIDFTRPEGTLKHAAYCAEHGIKMIIGTTGFDDAGKAAIAAAAEKTAIVFAPNMSVGVNVTMKLLEMAAKSFAQGYDIEIIEAHHRHKVDAPSGTALQMGEVVAGALGRKLRRCRGLCARRSDRRTRPVVDRFRHHPRRRHRRRPYRPVCRHRGAGRDHPQVVQPGPPTRTAACVPRASWPTAPAACTTCRMYSACAELRHGAPPLSW